MQMTDLAQVILGGVALGSIYTLMGKGLLVTYLTTRALNFGQGDFLMIGSFMAMALMLAGVPVYLMVPIVLIAMAGLAMRWSASRSGRSNGYLRELPVRWPGS